MREKYNLTSRMKRIMKRSNEIASPHKIEPIHLFLGACVEGTGVCGELYLYLTRVLELDFISQTLRSVEPCENSNNECYLMEGYSISAETRKIMKNAHETMVRYNQIYLNEGHVLAALLNDCEIPFITQEIKTTILNITSVPRDLTVCLNDFEGEDFSVVDGIEISRATDKEYGALCQFILAEFGDRWIEAVNNGFKLEQDIPIFISKVDEEIVGFACFDVVRNKKGLFGPMGTSKNCRKKGIGKKLLHVTLHKMKSAGYEYAIIGQAGPIEFYEENCNAKLIPIREI